MNIFDELEYLVQIDQLIRLKATGTPNQLASRLGLSRRQLLRDIALLRSWGLPIEYCKIRQCYFYSKSVKIKFEILIDDEQLIRIKGGHNPKFE